MKDFEKLERKLNITFNNKDLLVQAFCHRSFLNENPDFNLDHNERLEFLGDAVIELVVTEHLYKKFPDKKEGILTSWRSALVNTKMLSEIAKELGFDNFLLLSKGEAKNIKMQKKAFQDILADTFEAFIGALYLDRGYRAAGKFLNRSLLIKLPWVLKNKKFIDAKSKFQEEAQEREKITPAYRVLKEWGPDHARQFLVGVFLGEKLIAKGQGPSKQEAEEEAAKKALETKGWE
jgi:ribonuclease-3